MSLRKYMFSAIAVAVTVGQPAAANQYDDNINHINNSGLDIDSAINNLIQLSGQSYQTTTTTGVHQQAPSFLNQYQYQTGPNPFLQGGSSSTSGAKSSSILRSDAPPAIAAKKAFQAAHDSSIKRCALYVRRALQAAGYKITPQASAYMYANGPLTAAGFQKISKNNYNPQVGDIIVFNRTPKNVHGHIQIFNGNQWVSDFKQPSMMVYGNNHNGYSIWRDARYIDASQRDGSTLAMRD